MPERNAPKVNSYTIGGAETLIYSPDLAPRDVPVSFFNAGEVVVKIRFSGTEVYIPLAPGTGMTANPDPLVYATTDSGSSTVITATGVNTFASGVTSTGASGLSSAESQAIAAAHTQKSLLVEILLEGRLRTELLKLIADTELTVSDFPNWTVPQ
jgi:hypothetical protein